MTPTVQSKPVSEFLPEDFELEVIEERPIPLQKIGILQYRPNAEQSPINQTLYESIKAVGLQSPLVVAQKPNCDRFLPIAGGNSRIHALRQLHDDTGEESFATVRCVVSKWPGSIRARLGHVITNQVRIRKSFATSASAIVHIISAEALNEESNLQSQRRAVELLTTNGYSISQATYSCMLYLVNRLKTIVTEGLLHDLSVRKVRELRELDNCASEVGRSQSNMNLYATDPFASLLIEASKISRSAEELVEFVRQGRNVNGMPYGDESACTLDSNFTAQDPESNSEIKSKSDLGIQKEDPPTTKKSLQPSIEMVSGPNSTTKKTTDGQAKATSLPRVRKYHGVDINELRETAWNLGAQLCKEFGMEACIKKDWKGLGFQIVAEPSGEDASLNYRVWNYLYVFTGGCTENLNGIDKSELDDSNSGLYRARGQMLDSSVWSELSDEDWTSLTALWDVVRAMRRKQSVKAIGPLPIEEKYGESRTHKIVPIID